VLTSLTGGYHLAFAVGAVFAAAAALLGAALLRPGQHAPAAEHAERVGELACAESD
jgi:hypothetical protein